MMMYVMEERRNKGKRQKKTENKYPKRVRVTID
jgi:hypothetical protein